MTIRTFSLAAAALALALGTAGPASAGMKTLTSDTWKPGYQLDDNNRYIKIIHVDEDTGYKGGRAVTVERRDTWRPGFQRDGEGFYVKVIEEDGISNFATAAGAEPEARPERRDIWAPGFSHDDEGGGYIRD